MTRSITRLRQRVSSQSCDVCYYVSESRSRALARVFADPARKYTDVDYVVFTDAAREAVTSAGNVTASSVQASGDGVAALWFGLGSPFDRATYRYTPFLAWLAIPNLVLFFAWGKVVFSCVDVLVGWLIRQSLEARGVATTTAKAYACLWWFSPVAMNISTRGSADCIAVALSLAALSALLRRRDVEAAVWLGCAVHFKIYPALFAIPMALFIDHHYDALGSGEGVEQAPTDEVGLALHAADPSSKLRRRRVPGNRAEADDGIAGSSGRSRSSSTASRGPKAPRAAAHALSSAFSTEEDASDPHERIQDRICDAASLTDWIRGFLRWRRVRFGLVALAVCGALTALAWLLYGDRCLADAYLYHFGRTDPRHNFSPYFYALYLSDGGPGATFAKALGLAAFAPQLAVVLAAGFLLYRDLPLALTVQAVAFVAFNKVCTAQYFLWWQGLLPVAAASLFTTRQSWWGSAGWWVVMGLWFGAQVNWLLWASELEEAGRAVFLPLWGAGMVFLAVNTLLMVWLLMGRGVPVMWRGKPVRLGDSASGGAVAWLEGVLKAAGSD